MVILTMLMFPVLQRQAELEEQNTEQEASITQLQLEMAEMKSKFQSKLHQISLFLY